MKIAIGGFQHETNTFQREATDYDAFLRGGGWPGLTRGEALFDAVAGRNLPIAGFVAAAARRRHALVPLLWANAPPSGRVVDGAFERIAAMLIGDLAAQLPVDAVYLDLHGAMVTGRLDDGEGELLRRVRAVVGPDALVVASLDWHANVTEQMVEAADWLTAYRTYPHIDMAETGARAAALLDRGRSGGRALRRLDFLIPLTAQCSLAEPNLALFQHLVEIEAETGAAVTFAPGFPAADVPFAGPAMIAYAATAATASVAADRMIAAAAAAEADFARAGWMDLDVAIAEAMALARTATRPIVLADTQDNPGAGAGSDTTGILQALIKAGAEGVALALLHDPAAAELAHRAGLGAEIAVALGGRSGVEGDTPLEVQCRVGALAEGPFPGTGPIWQGGALDLGRMARLDIGGISVVIGSVRQQPSTKAIFRRVGLYPEAQSILVLKSSVHFRADFQDIAERVIIVRAPGVNLADPAEFPYQKLRPDIRLRPLGPTR